MIKNERNRVCEEWNEILKIHNKDQVSSKFPPLPEAMGIPKEILLERLLDNLKDRGNYSEIDINDIRRVYEHANKAFSEAPGKDKRESGDEYITHPLWMAVFISETVTCDKDVIMATILHDNPEDTGMTLEEVENITNPDVANLDEILTKVKTEKVMPLQNSTEDKLEEKRQKEKDDGKTQLKLLDALEKDIRAFLIKGTDVIHNQMTSDHMPKETRERKAKLALDFYEPILRRLGFTYMADLIGDFALRSVELPSYEQIRKQRGKFNEIMLPLFNQYVNVILETDSNQTLSCPDIIQIKAPSIYQISQKIHEHETLKDSFMPQIEAVFKDENTLFQWHRMLRQLRAKTNNNGDIDQSLDSGKPVVDTIILGEDDEEITLNFHLYTKDSLIMPSHLYTDGIELNVNEENVAIHKLASIIRHYRQELQSEGDLVASVKEAALRGTIDILDKDGNAHSIPNGSTVSDYAFILGKNLGKDAVGAKIYKKGVGEEWHKDNQAVDISTTLEAGDKVVIETNPEQIIAPSKYEAVTTNKAITNIREFIDTTLKNIGLDDKQLEALYKGEAILEVYALLLSKIAKLPAERRVELEKFIISIEERGTNLIKKLYESRREKKLDSNIMSVFDDGLSLRFQNLDTMYFYIGLTPIPFRDGKFLENWQNTVNPEFESIRLNNSLVKELTRFRDTRVTMLVSITNQPGVIEKIGELAKNNELNIQTIRTFTENEPRKGESATIEVVFENGDMGEVTKAMAVLWDIQEYHKPGFNISFSYSYLAKEKDEFIQN